MQQRQAAGYERLTPQQNVAMILASEEVTGQEKGKNRQLIALQLAVVSVIAAVYFGYGATPQETIAAWCGGGISVFNSMLIAWRMKRAERQALYNAQLQLRLLFFYAAERFLLVMIMLGLLMAGSHYPLAVLGGFVAGQATMMIARLYIHIQLQTK